MGVVAAASSCLAVEEGIDHFMDNGHRNHWPFSVQKWCACGHGPLGSTEQAGVWVWVCGGGGHAMLEGCGELPLGP